MTGYTKLFGTIIASTIWRESKETKIVWITLLAMANQYGIAEGSVPGLADFSRVTLSECEDALRVLSSPDSYSRTKEHEGRRIEAIDGGWRLLNHGKYRAKMNEDDRREYLRKKQQEHRAKQSVNTASTNVNKCQPASTPSTQSESYSEAKAEQIQKKEGQGGGRFAPPTLDMVKLECAKIGLPDGEGEKFMAHHEARGWMLSKARMRRWQSALITWRGYWQERSPVRNGLEVGASKPLSIYEIKTILEAKQVLATTIYNQHYSPTAIGGSWDDPEKKKKYFTLKTEIKDLNRKIGERA